MQGHPNFTRKTKRTRGQILIFNIVVLLSGALGIFSLSRVYPQHDYLLPWALLLFLLLVVAATVGQCYLRTRKIQEELKQVNFSHSELQRRVSESAEENANRRLSTLMIRPLVEITSPSMVSGQGQGQGQIQPGDEEQAPFGLADIDGLSITPVSWCINDLDNAAPQQAFPAGRSDDPSPPQSPTKE